MAPHPVRLDRRLAMLTAALMAAVLGVACARSQIPGSAPSASPSPTVSASSSPELALCSGQAAELTVASQEGAAGTISTVWQVKNTSSAPCQSDGYPTMDFHASAGWLGVQVHQGGYPNIDQPPAAIVIPAGESLYLVSYWGDATTDAGNCQDFDRVRVTLPDAPASVEVASSGCVDAESVRVGPVVDAVPQ